jgi:hypothetical protein
VPPLEKSRAYPVIIGSNRSEELKWAVGPDIKKPCCRT